MTPFPTYPPPSEAAESTFETGHLWLLEEIDGWPLRVRCTAGGTLRFGTERELFEEGSVPAPYQPAVRHVRESIDRSALTEAVATADSIDFFGVSTHKRRIDYEWDRLAPFVGVNIWSAAADAFLPPDVVQAAYRRLGLEPATAIQKEQRATDFDPDRYEVPASAWYDGPAFGVLVRNKNGHRARIRSESIDQTEGPTRSDVNEGPNRSDVNTTQSDATLAAELATDDRFDAIERKLESDGVAVTFDTVYERVFDRIVREHHHRLFETHPPVDVQSFRSKLAEITRRRFNQ
ncbi:MAG: hypothetical protein ACQETB_05320 [Halobacteriota archaeon]